MNAQTVILHIPETLYREIERHAEQTQRTVEAELLERVAATKFDSLSDELEAALASLHLLPDQALWDAARSRFPESDAEELETLHFKRQRVGLSQPEQQRAEELVQQYQWIMLVRAQAAALLKERGYDLSSLLVSHDE